jgi:excisionase family DNA binding protein
MADTTSPQSKMAPALGRGVTPRAAAELCHVHPNTIRRWIAEGRLPAYRVGPRRLRVDLADVEALIVPTATP